ncbi:MAG: flagellar biosynthesis protein FlgM [Lysobacterales bacterium]|jgi:predicted metalloprotease|nr:MAG: flagellar biosynthesis protein FlgM [Xanthomonadales bacterium]
MDIRGRRQSSNIEDRRGMRPVRTGIGLSVGGLLFLGVLTLLGINPLPFLGLATKAPEVQMQQTEQPYQESPREAQLRELTSVVLADTEETWTALLPKYNVQYAPPTIVLFNQVVQSACGTAESAMGPFYCPLDQKVYIDMSFYDELAQRFGAPGDFAQAYVIAHEVGHHVQNLVGTAGKVRQLQERAGQAEANALSVRMELQADCYAGVWAHHAARSRNLLESGDIEEGLNAASQIGDDRMQRRSQGYVVPDGFTHGSAEQRQRWFRRGIESGQPEACDTFSVPQV